MSEGAFFRDLAVLMTVAGVVSVIFSKLRWPKVLGYLGAGILMSEYTWGGRFLSDEQSIRTIGQLGVVFLMFGMGLSFSPKDMRRIRAVALPSAVIDTVVMIWIGYSVGTHLFGWGAIESFFLGVAICDSATTLLAKVIDELGWSKRPFTRYVLGTSICEDVICVGAIAVATGFARGGGMSLWAFAGSLWWLLVFFAAVLVFGFVLVPRFLTSTARNHDDEALLLAVLGVCFFISFFAYQFNFSLALGAFLVGILASCSGARDRIMALADPLKSMFAAVFFVSIGLLVDPAAMFHHAPQILVVSAVVIVGKTLTNTTAALATGLEVRTAIQHGLSLAQIGEFAFMVAIIYAGLRGTTEMFPIAVGASLLTTLANPLLIRLSERVGILVERKVPVRFLNYHNNYCAWLEKIRSSEDSPAYLLLRTAVIRLGVYAITMFAFASLCAMATKLDYSRFSELFERYDSLVFFLLPNLFAIGLLPMIVPAARTVGDEVTELLLGEEVTSWNLAVRQLMRSVIVGVVLAAFFAEMTMINVALAPQQSVTLWVMVAITLIIVAVGWRFFVRAGHRAAERFHEAVTAEERREGIVKMMTISVPEGTIRRFQLDAGSPAIGATVGSLSIRAKTGASIVSVYRQGEITRNIGPDWEFAVGDVLVAIGEPHQIAALKDLLGVVA